MKLWRILLVLLMCSATVLAASGTDGEGAQHFDWAAFLGKVLNSVILFGGLIYLLRKPLIAFLSRRSQDIQNDIQGREQNLQANTRKLEALDQRLARIEEELGRIRQAAEEAGRTEMDRLQEQGRSETERLLALTEKEINVRLASSLRQLKERIADLTIDRFAVEARKRLDTRAQRKFIDRNIAQSGDLDDRQ